MIRRSKTSAQWPEQASIYEYRGIKDNQYGMSKYSKVNICLWHSTKCWSSWGHSSCWRPESGNKVERICLIEREHSQNHGEHWTGSYGTPDCQTLPLKWWWRIWGKNDYVATISSFGNLSLYQYISWKKPLSIFNSMGPSFQNKTKIW